MARGTIKRLTRPWRTRTTRPTFGKLVMHPNGRAVCALGKLWPLRNIGSRRPSFTALRTCRTSSLAASGTEDTAARAFLYIVRIAFRARFEVHGMMSNSDIRTAAANTRPNFSAKRRSHGFASAPTLRTKSSTSEVTRREIASKTALGGKSRER